MMEMQSKKFSLNGKPDLDLYNELNTFQNLFNVHDFSDELSVFKNAVPELNSVHVDWGMVLENFWGVKEKQSSSPDGIGDCNFKNCTKQLADMLCFIFTSSHQLLACGIHLSYDEIT